MNDGQDLRASVTLARLILSIDRHVHQSHGLEDDKNFLKAARAELVRVIGFDPKEQNGHG